MSAPVHSSTALPGAEPPIPLGLNGTAAEQTSKPGSDTTEGPVPGSGTSPVAAKEAEVSEVTPQLGALSLSAARTGSFLSVFTQNRLLHILLALIPTREVVSVWPWVCKALLPGLREFPIALDRVVEDERYCLDISWYLDNAEAVRKWWKVRSCDIVLEGRDTVKEWVNTGFWKADAGAIEHVLIHDHRKKHKAELSMFHSYWEGLRPFTGLRSVKIRGAVRVWPKAPGFGLDRIQVLNLVSCQGLDTPFGFDMCTSLTQLTLNKVSDMMDCSYVGKAKK